MGEATSPDQTPSTSPFAESSLLASNVGATAGEAGAVPSMIGDFFGNNYLYAFTNPDGTTVATAGGAALQIRREHQSLPDRSRLLQLPLF